MFRKVYELLNITQCDIIISKNFGKSPFPPYLTSPLKLPQQCQNWQKFTNLISQKEVSVFRFFAENPFFNLKEILSDVK